MIVEVIKDANILIPNGDHKNFTHSENYIPAGKELEGELKYIKGKRRGQPFIFRLFKAKSGNLIYQNTIKPKQSEMTEVTLGADAEVSPTKVALTQPKENYAHIIGAAGGTIAGYAIAKKTKKTQKQTYMYAIGGAIIGYVAGKLVAGKPIINITIGS